MYKPIRILEIGIYNGDSLKLWNNYFRQASVFGIDIEPKNEYDTDIVKTFVADQANRSQLQSFIDTHGGDFDIIVDDGGHYMEQQQVSFGFLFPFVKPGGYYVIEDLHTSLPNVYPEFRATPANSTLSMIENFIRKNPDNIHSMYMTIDEMNYLQSHIDFVSLNTRNRSNRSMTCLFKKK
jgi:SAM-dependent methyltransferase